MSPALHDMGVAELGRALALKHVSSAEAAQHLLTRVATFEHLGAFLAHDAERTGRSMAEIERGATLLGRRLEPDEVSPLAVYLASNDARVHFGLGSVPSIDRILVHWPDGPVETCVEEFAGTQVDCDLIVERGRGQLVKEQQ